MPDHKHFANLIWQIADLLRGPYRPPQYERVMLPMTALRRCDCVVAPTKTKVLAEYERSKPSSSIARATAQLDDVLAATEHTIALLRERRSAPIADAVTEQVDIGARLRLVN